MSADKQQSRKFFSCTAIVLLILLLSALWVWYQLRVFAPTLSTQFQMMALFTAAMVLTILIVLRQLSFDAVQRIEALISSPPQTDPQPIDGLQKAGHHKGNREFQKQIAEQLQQINEQLAIRNRRTRKVLKVITAVIIAVILVNMVLLAVNFGTFESIAEPTVVESQEYEVGEN